jgi:hypothetical protein
LFYLYFSVHVLPALTYPNLLRTKRLCCNIIPAGLLTPNLICLVIRLPLGESNAAGRIKRKLIHQRQQG